MSTLSTLGLFLTLTLFGSGPRARAESQVALAAIARLPQVVSYDLTLVLANTDSLQLSPTTVDLRWPDPQTPSCLEFEFRKRQLLKQSEELTYLIDQLARRAGQWSAQDRHEIEQLVGRQENLQREFKAQSLQLIARFATPTGGLPDWVKQRRYRLEVQAASLQWTGFDAAEPVGFSLREEDDGLSLRHSFYLADACAKPLAVSVRLTQTVPK